MLSKSTVGIAVIAVSVGVAGCNRPAPETRDEAKETATKVAAATVEAQRQRDAEVSRLQERITEIERDYLAKSEQLAAGEKAATGGLREDVREDVGSDVRRLAGNAAEPAPVATDTPATAPFTSRRDAFVTATKGRVNTARCGEGPECVDRATGLS